MTAGDIRRLAAACGLEVAGVAKPWPVPDIERFDAWIGRGLHGEMGYLADHRAEVRRDPAELLPTVRSIVCVGKIYKQPATRPAGAARISQYALGRDYHLVMREALNRLAAAMGSHEYRVVVDTAPLLERSYARKAGLGWIGKNTCLINQELGSWLFLGEILTSLEIEPDGEPADRCGTCTRCIDACPTDAIVPRGDGYELDARRCIAYLTIELRGDVPEALRPHVQDHVFGCDICQDVCPWNGKASAAADAEFAPRQPVGLKELAELSAGEFRARFRDTAVTRARHRGLLRNAAIAMGNSGDAGYREPLERLAEGEDALVASHARWALERIRGVE